MTALQDENGWLKSRLAQYEPDRGQAAPATVAPTWPAPAREWPAPAPAEPARLRARAEAPALAGAPLTQSELRAAVSPDTIGVLVIACKRPEFLKRALASVLGHRPSAAWPVVISQDGDHAPMTSFLATYPGVYAMRHEWQDRSQTGYAKLAIHYGWALSKMFTEFGFHQVVVLEEDMEVAPDFFEYFLGTLPLLRDDPTLYCVSAWNDNGVAALVEDATAIHRTDVFPGLGWMLTKKLWAEIGGRWPQQYWDEWMRRPDVRRDRQCLRPEVNRAFTFGNVGESHGQFFEQHLAKIRLNDEFVAFADMDLSYLRGDVYPQFLQGQVEAATEVTLDTLGSHRGHAQAWRIHYTQRSYAQLAKFFGLMADEKEGLRRASFRQALIFSWKEHRVFLYDHWPRL